MSASTVTEVTSKTLSLQTLPNELLNDIASNLTSFQDLNSLICTNRLFHHLFTSELYDRFNTTTENVRDAVVKRVLSRGQITALTSLLDNGLPVEFPLSFELFGTYHGGALLKYACSVEHEQAIPMARLLIERGADIEAKSGAGNRTALQYMANSNLYGPAEFLLKMGADVNVGRRYRKPLNAAADWSNPKMASLLVEYGADVSVLDDEDRMACGLGHL